MSEHASPVSSPPFKYTSFTGLYVDTPVYEGRHRRCSSTRLYELLTYEDPGPAYTKAGQLKIHQPPKHRDEPQNFYTAQCVHYGLNPFKSKQAAKKALLAAHEGSANGLTVPENILRLEKNLADEYKEKNIVAEKEFREKRKLQKEEEEGQRKKRKRADKELLAEVLGDPSTSGNGAKKSKPNDVGFVSRQVIDDPRTYTVP